MYRWDCTVERNWQQKEMYPECCRTLQLRVKVKGEGPVTELTGPTLGSSSFAYEHAHTPWNQASYLYNNSINAAVYHAVIDRHLHVWKRHQNQALTYVPQTLIHSMVLIL